MISNLFGQDIDVVIPVFNGERFIARAIESIVAQTLRPRSIIVVNDGSTDGSRQAALAVDTRGIPLEVVDRPHIGVNAARNEGVRRSAAPWIAFLDADDEWLPEKLEQQAAVVTTKRYANVGLVYCSYQWIDESGRVVSAGANVPLDPAIRGRCFDRLLPENRVLSSSSGVLIRSECFQKAGMFDESLRVGEDWDMWLRIAEHYDLDYSEEVLVRLRRHPASCQADPSRLYQGLLEFVNKWVVRVPESKIPREWRELVTKMPLTDSTNAGLLHLAPKTLSAQTQKILFANAGGSIALFVMARAGNEAIHRGYQAIRAILAGGLNCGRILFAIGGALVGHKGSRSTP